MKIIEYKTNRFRSVYLILLYLLGTSMAVLSTAHDIYILNFGSVYFALNGLSCPHSLFGQPCQVFTWDLFILHNWTNTLIGHSQNLCPPHTAFFLPNMPSSLLSYTYKFWAKNLPTAHQFYDSFFKGFILCMKKHCDLILWNPTKN